MAILRRDGSISPNPPPGPNESFVAVACGENHSLALRSDGAIVAWGLNDDGQCDVPQPNTGYLAIAAAGDVVSGHGLSFAVNSSGSILVWGHNPLGYFDVPEPNIDFVSVSAGPYRAVGIKADGRAVHWGVPGSCEPPEPNSGFVAAACGSSVAGYPPIPMTLLLRDNGFIEMCGGFEPQWPEPNSGFVALAAGGWQGLAVRGQPTASINLAFEPVESIRAFPNPFSVWTTITGLNEEANVTIYNALGRSVRRLNGRQWDGLNEQGQVVAAGSYFAKVDQAGGSQIVLRLLKVNN
jgi:hypothetical protein